MRLLLDAANLSLWSTAAPASLIRTKHTLLAGAALALLLAVPHPAQAGEGFSISVDGERVAGDAPVAATGATQPDIQVKFDGLEVKPLLNVATPDGRRAYAPGETVPFLASLNYPAWVARQEVLIFERGRTASARPVAVLPVDAGGNAAWTMPDTGEGEYAYVLRVSDSQNRFDETVPLTLSRASGTLPPPPNARKSAAPGLNEDRTAVRNIPVRGGAVTVYGSDVPPGEHVEALGESVPVDPKGAFVVQRILPPGEQEVKVAVSGPDGVSFSRPVVIPENEWFYVGLADFTAGKHFGGGVEAAGGGDYDKVWTRGRVAFYLKGKIKGSTLLTAAVNTGEGELGDLFKDFDSKDPRGILRRIDPDSYYPVYGDDSTAVEGAPTQGKFYVRLDRGDSHALWGRFKAEINDSRLVRNERTLYGAQALYRSESATSFGERRAEVKAYAARPGTLQARDVLRGTGGSAYFLKHQDVLRDTETLTVVVTEDASGRVLSRRRLVAGEDYDINYFQGVVVLKKPLQSTTTDGRVVRDGALGEQFVNLVANYEYTPASGAVDDMAAGGEAGAWLNDHVRVGATAMKEETGFGDQKMGGVNARLRATDSTFLEAEIAATKGPGLRRSLSTDGGLTSVDDFSSGRRGREGKAWSLRGEVDLADIDPALKGRVQAWIEEKQRGFAALDYDIDADQRTAGLAASYDLSGRTQLRATVEDFEDDDGRTERRAALEAERKLSREWAVALGVTGTELDKPLVDESGSGRRVDAGAKVTYSPNQDTALYAFGQATVLRRDGIRRNDRIGVGAKRKLTETVGVEGEVSEGTSGLGALAALTYDPTADDHYYAGYRLDPDELRSATLDGTDLGGVVVGAKRRYSDLLSGYAENKYDMFGRRRSLNSTYGVVYTPDKFWTLDGGVEAGRINDPNDSDFRRKALSLGGAYRDGERLSASLKGELRLEDSEDGKRDRDSYLASAGFGYKVSEDWRLLAGIDAVISQSDQASILDGDFIDANLGFAYRPVAQDRLNALAKYRFVYDLPGPDQVTADGETLGPAQRSSVVSVDVNYDLTKLVAVGAKYGLRFGEISQSREPDDFERSLAQLGVVRADLNFTKDWSALLEGRILAALESDTTRKGVLAALYHDISGNMKVGAGYNFADFSDDLADLTYDDQGAFVNAVGQF